MRSYSDSLSAPPRTPAEALRQRRRGVVSILLLCAVCLLINLVGIQLVKYFGSTPILVDEN